MILIVSDTIAIISPEPHNRLLKDLINGVCGICGICCLAFGYWKFIIVCSFSTLLYFRKTLCYIANNCLQEFL